jgi:hypothetical protein
MAQYLPVSCRSCGRAGLAEVRAESDVTCQRCGARASIVPGEAYQERDAALFDQLEDVVHDAQLSEPDASQVAALLTDVSKRTRAPELVMSRVLAFLPKLTFLSATPPAERSRLVRALGMLLPIIGTRFRHPRGQAPSA